MNIAQGARTAKAIKAGSVTRVHSHDRAPVIRLLQSEHRAAMSALDECRKSLASGDAEFAHALALQMCVDIERHVRMDARVLHRRLRGILHKETFTRRQDIDHQIKNLLIELRRWTRADDAEGRANFQALGQLFSQHVKLEESMIFHQLAHARLNWLQMQIDLLQCREELLKETIVV